MSILEAIGNTSLIQLRKLVPVGCGRIFAQLGNVCSPCSRELS